MTVSTLFFIFIGILIIGVIGALLNFLRVTRDPFNSDSGFSSVFFWHVILALLCSLSGLGALISGVVWVVQQFKG